MKMNTRARIQPTWNIRRNGGKRAPDQREVPHLPANSCKLGLVAADDLYRWNDESLLRRWPQQPTLPAGRSVIGRADSFWKNWVDWLHENSLGAVIIKGGFELIDESCGLISERNGSIDCMKTHGIYIDLRARESETKSCDFGWNWKWKLIDFFLYFRLNFR